MRTQPRLRIALWTARWTALWTAPWAPRRWAFQLLLLLLCLHSLPATLPKAMAAENRSLLLLLRHAYAPGVGDPANFDVTDCTTQRNLDAQGRQQSQQIGAQIRSLGLQPSQIWTSQWCRSSETATLTGLGEVKPLTALNSFFRNPADGPAQIKKLRDFIANLDPKGGPYLMVSHQVVVSGLTNQWVNSGDGVWLVLTGKADAPWTVYPAATQKLSLPPGF
jgi:phosphohistidine phosphatase SixA